MPQTVPNISHVMCHVTDHKTLLPVMTVSPDNEFPFFFTCPPIIIPNHETILNYTSYIIIPN